MLLKNTCERVHLIAKLPAIVCNPENLLKMNFFTQIFEGFKLDFLSSYLLCFL